MTLRLRMHTQRFALLITASIVLFSLAATASPLATIQIVNGNGGRIVTAHAEQHGDTVYIGGLVNRPAFPVNSGHVHVWGVGKDHDTVFSTKTPIRFTGDPSQVHSESFQVSVSAAAMNKAKSVYVTFQNHTGPETKLVP